MTHQGLTTRGRQLLGLQLAHIKEHGSPATPTFLSRRLGMSRQQAYALCRQLVERGYMEQREGSGLYWPVEGDSNEEG